MRRTSLGRQLETVDALTRGEPDDLATLAAAPEVLERVLLSG